MADKRWELLCLDLPRAEALRRWPMTRLSARPRKALGDPTRLLAALALRDGTELCVCDLAWVLGRAENLVSHHVRALRGGAGPLAARGKMVPYALTATGVALVNALVPAGEQVPA